MLFSVWSSVVWFIFDLIFIEFCFVKANRLAAAPGCKKFSAFASSHRKDSFKFTAPSVQDDAVNLFLRPVLPVKHTLLVMKLL
jgi:hypothetical protein